MDKQNSWRLLFGDQLIVAALFLMSNSGEQIFMFTQQNVLTIKKILDNICWSLISSLVIGDYRYRNAKDVFLTVSLGIFTKKTNTVSLSDIKYPFRHLSQKSTFCQAPVLAPPLTDTPWFVFVCLDLVSFCNRVTLLL